ncbi:hypothetical protein CVT25_000896 [Psilocybe cyanescens]|uniref:CNNM transmembrane domain-containing protein n=1 Tax=Psilocybe cyanescens TaxID=93625 RepID=A0A409WZA9_PSICY|nr:hypothetical protein CVT25_000896 [Psilocybe cyanescens]
MKLRIPTLILLLRVVSASPHHHIQRKPKIGHPQPDPEEFWFHVTVSAFLVLTGGVFAGLTLGLMGLDELHLRVLAHSSEDIKQKKNAQTVLKLMQRGKHWVLVVLLLGNVIVNESLPIFLDSALGGGYTAIAISTASIVIFGEYVPSVTCSILPTLISCCPTRIIPQAVSVRYGLSIGAKCAPFVLGMMFLLAPIAWPIAKILDMVLGTKEQHTYKKAELKSFLQFHRTGDEPLRDDEITILNGVLELNTKKVEAIMTPLKDTVVLSSDDILDYPAVHTILQSGYSRFPVHEKGNKDAFIGLLLVKTLLTYDPKQALPVSSFPLSILPEASPSINCFQALDYLWGLQTGRAHLILISRTPGKVGGALGVITLEGRKIMRISASNYHSSSSLLFLTVDIIEEIISEEIVDETDMYEDNRSKRRARRQMTSNILGGIVEHPRRAAGIFNENSSLVERVRRGALQSELITYGSV